MEVLNLDDGGILGRVVSVLRQGEVVAVPTDTVYGLVCDALNGEAARRIYEMKGREEGKPLLWFVSSVEQAREYAEIGGREEEFLHRVWPGAVTAVLKIKDQGSRINGQDETIGMRIPKDDFLIEVLRETGGPLAQTSANISGQPPARSAEEVCAYFSKIKYAPALVVDGGERGGEASTLVDLSVFPPRILRSGPVSKDRLGIL